MTGRKTGKFGFRLPADLVAIIPEKGKSAFIRALMRKALKMRDNPLHKEKGAQLKAKNKELEKVATKINDLTMRMHIADRNGTELPSEDEVLTLVRQMTTVMDELREITDFWGPKGAHECAQARAKKLFNI